MSKEVILSIKVIPKSHRNQIVGWENGELKVRLKAVPEKGKANDMLLRFLADELETAVSQLHIVSGLTSRHKKVSLNETLIASLLQRFEH